MVYNKLVKFNALKKTASKSCLFETELFHLVYLIPFLIGV
jgi:hypothetical protein